MKKEKDLTETEMLNIADYLDDLQYLDIDDALDLLSDLENSEYASLNIDDAA